MLQFNPDKRLSAEEAVQHPYVVQFRDPDDEPVCPGPIRIPIDDNTKFTILDYRSKLYDDIKRKKKEQKKRMKERAKKKPPKKEKKERKEKKSKKKTPGEKKEKKKSSDDKKKKGKDKKEDK